ncbi:ribonuclease HI [Buchnera aphidicola (Thelaxes californica)]|uniref:Ribonuclease H n=1 Tax=Buchnera aphidicola (Thelaxes californica) TaxID=1315998 RepID=A0A4D6YM04_9GAMM|nr:ribonuclease HI [Buchnera aphidicola]QCI26728.1 ribonuclease HI [Buchnera aphidicola (Thelaxes californica)]
MSEKLLKKIKIFTDGSCLGNPGPGGCCALIKYKQYIKKICSSFYLTTNNRMEIMGAILGLEMLKETCKVTIMTDSQYLKLGIVVWIQNWRKKNWKTKNNKTVKNIDLWLRLEKIINLHKVKWIWIKGHSIYLENNLCDQLAKKAALNPKEIDIGYQKST